MKGFRQSKIKTYKMGMYTRAYYVQDNGDKLFIGMYAGTGTNTYKMIVEDAKRIVTNVN